jgi:hypothetical protein
MPVDAADEPAARRGQIAPDLARPMRQIRVLVDGTAMKAWLHSDLIRLT